MNNNTIKEEKTRRQKKVGLISSIIGSICMAPPTVYFAIKHADPFLSIMGGAASGLFAFTYSYFSAYGLNYFKPKLNENGEFIKPSDKLKAQNISWHAINLITLIFSGTYLFAVTQKPNSFKNDTSDNLFMSALGGMLFTLLPYVSGLYFLDKTAKKESAEQNNSAYFNGENSSESEIRSKLTTARENEQSPLLVHNAYNH